MPFGRGIAVNLWLRSPWAGSSTNFANVNNNGNSNNNNATNGNSFSFGSSLTDKVSIRRNQFKWREGEHNHPTWVNISLDAFERTLLAWQRLQIILCFILKRYVPICNLPAGIQGVRSEENYK